MCYPSLDANAMLSSNKALLLSQLQRNLQKLKKEMKSGCFGHRQNIANIMKSFVFLYHFMSSSVRWFLQWPPKRQNASRLSVLIATTGGTWERLALGGHLEHE